MIESKTQIKKSTHKKNNSLTRNPPYPKRYVVTTQNKMEGSNKQTINSNLKKQKLSTVSTNHTLNNGYK